MYRLGELTKVQRVRYGWTLLIFGFLGLAVGVWWVHYSSFLLTSIVDGVETPVTVDYFGWVPRGKYWKGLGYLVALGASQMMLGGAAIRFVLGEKMTWARAAFASWLAWIELVLIFGIVPSEWLNFSQTDLDWSNEKIAFTVPPILVLGNVLKISMAAIKDSIAILWDMILLGAAGLFAYQVQKVGKGRPAAAKKVRVSPYGRPLAREEE